jgi:hypothetical protein
LISHSASHNPAIPTVVCATLVDPREIIKHSAPRAVELFKTILISTWHRDDIVALAAILSKALRLSLDEKEIATLMKAAGGSPRFVKMFFANYYNAFKDRENGFDEALSHTLGELP